MRVISSPAHDRLRAATDSESVTQPAPPPPTAATALPRWTLDPVPGVGEYEATIPDDIVAALLRLADELDVPLSSVLLAAHAKVLAALSGDDEVTTGYVAVEGGHPLPCGLTTGAGSWRELLLRSRAVEEGVLSQDPDLAEPPFEAMFDPTCVGGELTEDPVLLVSFPNRHGRLVLRLRYRTDVLDADSAARIAGYHLTALERIVTDPDAEQGRQSLVSAEELRYQLEGLAGPRRQLPDRRFHELFEERVQLHPEAVAGVQGERRWSYRELNDRANRLARALLARGLRREGVVAVVTERNLDWMAAVLAVFKAGGGFP